MAKKYIDADRLKAEIERRKQSLRAGICSDDAFTKEQKKEMLVASEEIDRFNRIIGSLKQEQLPGIEEHGIPGKDFIPVEWVDACEKYGKWKIVQQEQPELPQIERAEYYYHKGRYEGLSQGRADALKMLDEFMKRQANPVIVIEQQEQPEVDLEKEYKEYVEDDPVFRKLTNRNVGFAIARHFYELGLKSK